MQSKIGIIGCGAIGQEIAIFLAKELKDKIKVYALADQDKQKASLLKQKLKNKPLILDNQALIKQVDLVVEAASKDCAKEVVAIAIKEKKDVVILSVGAIIENLNLVRQAKARGINIYIPSGAICGLDGLGALSLGTIKEITITTSKPPAGFKNSDYLKSKGLDLAKINKPKVIFRGKVEQAIRYFPQNINVAATLLLAANLGKRDINHNIVNVCIQVNPKIKRNIHQIDIKAKEANFSLKIDNLPSKENPKTSMLTSLSVKYLFSKMFSELKLGS